MCEPAVSNLHDDSSCAKIKTLTYATKNCLTQCSTLRIISFSQSTPKEIFPIVINAKKSLVFDFKIPKTSNSGKIFFDGTKINGDGIFVLGEDVDLTMQNAHVCWSLVSSSKKER